MLANQGKRNEILKALRSGKLSSNSTPGAVHRLFNEEVFIAEYQLLVSVIGAEEYDVKVKQGRTVISDPEGDGYAVDTGKNVTVTVTAGSDVLEYKYKVEDNIDLEFNFEEGKVIVK